MQTGACSNPKTIVGLSHTCTNLVLFSASVKSTNDLSYSLRITMKNESKSVTKWTSLFPSNVKIACFLLLVM